MGLAATIKLVKNDNDIIQYEYHSTSPQIAVFSEIYYPGDGMLYGTPTRFETIMHSEACISRKERTAEFKFEPNPYLLGKTISPYQS